ncbi:MAG: hypothetical protein H7Y11_11125, partial [Armatimonadetes bacterium]|nr:hypothetical protein [Anaerolineae bacterium]
MTDDSNFRANMMEGMSKFQGLRMRAFWQEMISHLRGKSTELLSFEDIRTRLRLHEESYRGLQNVPLAQIVGSVGRYRDFTSSFLPRSNKMQERWSRVYAVANSMTGLPPIELYKVGDVYFVRDGNHRVSVARELDAETIEAHVTELATAVEFRPGMTEEEIDIAATHAGFLEETGLSRTRIHHQPLNLTEASRYADLMGHVYTHQALMQQTEKREVGLEEAAADWYDHIYRPAITLIRKYGIMQQISDRTEADLYLWLVDHLREVREQYGGAAPSRKFSHALVDFLEDRKLQVPPELTHELDDTVELTRSYID